MKRARLLFIGLLLFFSMGIKAFQCGRSYLAVHSQADCFNCVYRKEISPKKKVKVKPPLAHPECFDKCGCSKLFFAPGYTRSFSPCKTACYFFGGSTLRFSGSRVENRNSTDILADYFGLPSDFVSNVSFCPLIQDFTLDFRTVISLDRLHERMYLGICAPLVHTRRDLRLCESIQAKGETFSPAGYLSGGNQRLQRGQLVDDVKTAFKGKSTFGDMQEPLRYGKIDGTQKQTGIADLRFTLGWDFREEENYRVGGHLFLVCPTGTKPTAEFLFEPVVGNGHHWAVGLGGHGAWKFCQNEQDESEWRAFAAFELSHLIRSQQRRSFDFKTNGYGSRYMLLSVLDSTRDNLLEVPAGTSPTYQYIGHLIPAINRTTFDCRVSIGVQADFVLGVVYKRDKWDLDLSYKLWARSREKIKRCECLESGKYAAKGDAQMYGFFQAKDTGAGTTTYTVSLPLNPTQSKVTLYAGQGDGNANFRNENADNAAEAAVEAATTFNQITDEDKAAFQAAGVEIDLDPPFGSNPPVFLNDSDIDECSAASPRASSSRLSAKFTYQVAEKERWASRIATGLHVELGHSCAAVSSWKFWIGGEVRYW